MSIDPLRYTREVPDVWPKLLSEAQSVVASAPEGPVTEAMAEQIVQVVDGLGNEELEAARYYRLGRVMHDLNSILHLPGTREALVQSTAKSLVENIFRSRALGPPADRSKPPRHSDISSPILRSALKPYVARAVDVMPPAEHLLVDALSAVSATRILYLKELGEFAGESHEEDPPEAPSVRLSGIVNSTEAADSLCTAALAGVHGTLYRVMRKLGMDNALLRDIVASGVLDQADKWRKLGVGIASLRIDETGNYPLLDGLIRIVDGGGLEFDRTYLATSPPAGQVPQSDKHSLPTLHQERLICPAVQVRGFIPFMLGLVGDILTRTHTVYEQEALSRCPR